VLPRRTLYLTWNWLSFATVTFASPGFREACAPETTKKRLRLVNNVPDRDLRLKAYGVVPLNEYTPKDVWYTNPSEVRDRCGWIALSTASLKVGAVLEPD
jgi:hypothetical protein